VGGGADRILANHGPAGRAQESSDLPMLEQQIQTVRGNPNETTVNQFGSDQNIPPRQQNKWALAATQTPVIVFVRRTNASTLMLKCFNVGGANLAISDRGICPAD
jgi:hypothetical protein